MKDETANWFNGKGILAHKNKVSKGHTNHPFHLWSEPRWKYMYDGKSMDEQTLTMFKQEIESALKKQPDNLELKVLQEQLIGRKRFLEHVVDDDEVEKKTRTVMPETGRRKPIENLLDENSEEEKEKSPSYVLTGKLLDIAFSVARRLGSASEYCSKLETFKKNWKHKLKPIDFPASTTDPSAFRDMVRVLSYKFHEDIMKDIGTKHTVYFEDGSQTSLTNPSSWKFDTVSRGTRSYVTMVVKYLPKDTLISKQALWALPDEYGFYTDEKNVNHKRDGSGVGLFNTLLQVICNPHFGEAKIPDTSLGLKKFRSTCIEICSDNGPGLIKGVESFFNIAKKRIISDLPDSWDLTHHLHTVYDKIFERFDEISKHIQIMEKIVSVVNYPKRWNYLKSKALEAGRYLYPMHRVGETRWVVSQREEIGRFLVNLPTISF